MVWITCGLLWCFYQLFGLSFWRHPFTAEHTLLRHSSKSEKKQTHPNLGWPEAFIIVHFLTIIVIRVPFPLSEEHVFLSAVFINIPHTGFLYFRWVTLNVQKHMIQLSVASADILRLKHSSNSHTHSVDSGTYNLYLYSEWNNCSVVSVSDEIVPLKSCRK